MDFFKAACAFPERCLLCFNSSGTDTQHLVPDWLLFYRNGTPMFGDTGV